MDSLRPAHDGDWAAIDALADVAVQHVAGAPSQHEWANNRRAFSGSRRHHVVVRRDDIVGYGGVERSAQDPPDEFRMFVLVDWTKGDETARVILEQLESDLDDLDATRVWLREYAEDQPLIDFFADRGFSISAPYELDGLAIINLSRRV